MMESISPFITFFIALVWLANGLLCKILDLVPRHQEIVARILGDEMAPILTIVIGLGEVVIFFWVLSRKSTKICALSQILIIALMNILEFFLAPDLLLFGKFNIVFAILFMLLIYVNEFYLRSKKRS